MKLKDYPLLRGTIVAVNRDDRTCGILCVWCPNCRRHHDHSWDLTKDARFPEHRNAHCSLEGEFSKEGYLVAPWRQSDPESAAHVVKPGSVKKAAPSRKKSPAAPTREAKP